MALRLNTPLTAAAQARMANTFVSFPTALLLPEIPMCPASKADPSEFTLFQSGRRLSLLPDARPSASAHRVLLPAERHGKYGVGACLPHTIGPAAGRFRQI